MKRRISLPIIVEGRYDKIKIDSIFDARVFASDGFGVFNSKEKQALLRRISEGGVILLLDSDGGGVQIRAFLNSIIPKNLVHNLYIPEIKGRERRKSRASAAGTLGVEGMEREVIERVLAPFVVDENANDDAKPKKMITKVDLFFDKLTGAENSAAMRDKLCDALGLPHGMSANALLEALNIVTDYEGYKRAIIAVNRAQL